MEHTRNGKRFRANPIEVAIFSVITLVFVNSVYNLFYDYEGFNPRALTPMASNPITEGKRNLASISMKSLMNLDLQCEEQTKLSTQANKVRINGPLCNSGTTGGSRLVKSSIVNSNNQFNATIFTDVTSGKFSTDYIPLILGDNSIHIEFHYRDGKSHTSDLILSRTK